MIWNCTSIACPEQYDIYTESCEPVAYFRLRHGNLCVYPRDAYDIDWNTIIYERHYGDDRGCFESQRERNKMINLINLKINWYLFKQWFIKLFK